MAKLNAKDAAKLEAMGFEGLKTEEQAKAKLIAFLQKNEVEGVDNDTLKSLIDMAEVFADGSEEVEEDDGEEETSIEEVDDDEEVDDEGEDEEEEEEPVKKKTPVKSAAVVAKKQPVKSKKVEPEEEEEYDELSEEVEEIEKDKKTNSPKKSPIVSKKTKSSEAGGDKFDARNDDTHLKFLKPFNAIFDAIEDEEFQFDILKQGFTVRRLGKNAKITVLNYDELRIVDKKLFGNLYLNRFANVDDLLKVLPDEYADREVGMFRGESHPCIRKISQDEVLSILEDTEVLNVSLNKASTTDTKMGNNRQKLEENLKKNKDTAVTSKKTTIVTTNKPAVKQTAKKK